MGRVRLTPRRVWRQVHLWMGLSLGLILVIAGLSGSALVFYVGIDRALHPEIQVASGTAEPDWDVAIATLRSAFPDKAGPWRLEVVGDNGAIPARYYNPPETEGRAFAPMLVWLSPDGHAVLRWDYWGDTAMTWLYTLHYQLLTGRLGAMVMGYAGLACLVLLGSGIASWWPRRGNWDKSLRVKAGAAPIRALYDWHKLIGLVTIVPLVVLCATGAMLALPKETDAVLSMTMGAPAEPALMPSGQSHGGLGASANLAVTKARARLPGARLAWIEAPPVGGDLFRLRLQVQGDPSHRFPHSYVQVDGVNGNIIDVFDTRQQGASNVLKDWLHPLHDGSFGGLAGRLAWLVFGWAPPLLFGFGVARFLLRRRRTADTSC